MYQFQKSLTHYDITDHIFYISTALPQDEQCLDSSILCEPYQPRETGGKLAVLLRFMGYLPHVKLIWVTFKRSNHKGNRKGIDKS